MKSMDVVIQMNYITILILLVMAMPNSLKAISNLHKPLIFYGQILQKLEILMEIM